MTRSKQQNSKKNGSNKTRGQDKTQLSGFLPCFSKHVDNKFTIDLFYSNQVFVGKVREFMHAIVASPNTQSLNDLIHAKGGIQPIDPMGNSDDKKLCQELGWQGSKVYRVDYGKNSYRLLFGLDNQTRRCFILALDTKHQTRSGKYK